MEIPGISSVLFAQLMNIYDFNLPAFDAAFQKAKG